MIIAMCCTRNWYVYLLTELYALFRHNKVRKVYLFIEDDKIDFIKDKRVKFINVNDLPEYVKETSPNYKTKYSKMSYLRCFFSKVLNDDKVLYIDADALVVDDISDLWNTDFGDDVLVGVKEGGAWDKHLGTYGMDGNYINSGVLLMNLKAIREEKLDDSMIELLNKRYFEFPDQDVINLVCRNRIKYVSNIYNSAETTGIVNDAKILHYIRGNKGWIKTSPRSDIWYSFYKEVIGGSNMEIYKVKASKVFNDYGGGEIKEGASFTTRRVGEIFECSKERYEFLKEHGAAELVEVVPDLKKVELKEEPEEAKEEVIEKAEEKVVEIVKDKKKKGKK